MTEVRRAVESDIERCVDVLAAAFHDDPGTIVIEPDNERRAQLLPAFFRNFLAASMDEDGDVVVSGDPVAGVACWFGPDRHGPSPDALGAHGFGDVIAIAGDDATARLLAMVGELERQHAQLISGPHFRLDFFGVAPSSQRTGIGAALMEHGHSRADDLRLSCYLETFTVPNVRYYERRGYELVHEYQVGDGVTVYALIRRAAV